MFASSKTASVSGGYQISRSLRFNSADSAYLNRTPAGAGNRTTWTWSGWIKFSKITGLQFIFGASSDNYANNFTLLQMDNAASTLTFYDYTSAYNFELKPSMVFRDPSAWYHIVWAYDSNAATSSDRVKIYVNGNQVTAFSTASYPTSAKATVLNSAVVHNYGTSSYPISGYLTETNFIDGQALTPSSFGETDTQTGVWKPKAYSGSYGTNGFYLNFSDNSNTTAATLGKDYSGNGNNWTPNNFSVSAGVGNDSLVDSPTSYGTDTGVGGEVRGNYSTMNPLDNYNTNAAVAFTFSNGNLDVSRSNQSWASSRSTMAMSSGKWYAEMTVTASTAGTLNAMFGIAKPDFTINDYFGGQSGGYGYNAANGQKYNGGSGASYGATFTTNDVIGVAYDADAGSLVFYKNGTSQGTAYTGLSGTFCFAIGLFPQTSGSITATLNCGQRPFAYTAPSGFKALCTQNLPTPTIGATTATQAGKYFNPVLYTGTGSSLSVTGVGFQPDWVWVKGRSGATDHGLYDAVRGVQKQLESNGTGAETTETTGITAFGSDGFTTGALAQLNTSSATYVAWNWKANGSGSSNTAGSITSTVSANTTSGFSVVTYTGNALAATVGHGLGVAPSMYIVKSRSASGLSWYVYQKDVGNTKFLELNSTAAPTTFNLWESTNPTSSVFTISNNSAVNGNGTTFVAYCFAPIAGYSAFGIYTGNGSTDGPFVYTGFRPAFIIRKRSDSAPVGQENWVMQDVRRSPYNQSGNALGANRDYDEATFGTTNLAIDILSNGFKVRDSTTYVNASGGTYIYMAFAENPFKYSLAR
jgi:hypothetical protein